MPQTIKRPRTFIPGETNPTLFPPNSVVITGCLGSSIMTGTGARASEVLEWPGGLDKDTQIPRSYIWSKWGEIGSVGTRYTNLDDAPVPKFEPLVANFGQGVGGGQDFGPEWGIAYQAQAATAGQGDPDHLMVKLGVSGMTVSSFSGNPLSNIDPREERSPSGYSLYTTRYWDPAVTYCLANYDHVFVSGLAMTFTASDHASVGQPTYREGASEIWKANIKRFVVNFRDYVGIPDLRVVGIKPPLVNEVDYSNISRGRAQAEELLSEGVVAALFDCDEVSLGGVTVSAHPDDRDVLHPDGQGNLELGLGVGRLFWNQRVTLPALK